MKNKTEIAEMTAEQFIKSHSFITGHGNVIRVDDALAALRMPARNGNSIDMDFLRKLKIEPEYTDEKICFLDHGKSKALLPYADMHMNGYVIPFNGRCYVTDGALYVPSGETCAYNSWDASLREVLGRRQFIDYVHAGTVTTEYGATLDVFRLDTDVQQALRKKYRRGWISVNSMSPEPGLDVMVKLEDGTVTWSESPSRHGNEWEFYGVCYWQYKEVK
jgi:hypothetical protein